jgi:pimeloyl-ACP methyl ester carboxylesterase
VISIDLRGHGESAPSDLYALDALAADVKAVTDAVGAAFPALVGHSLGGFVASVYGALYPTRSIVNVDQPLALAGFKDQLSSIQPLLEGDGFEQVMVQMFDGMMEPLPDAERRRLSDIRRPEQQVVLGIWEAVFEMSVEELETLTSDMLDGIESPYLTILGDDLGPGYSAWLHSVIPQAEIEVWIGSGHYPHLGEPDRFVERLRTFIG